jgi:glyoxylase-like metal-dependent hydrolase (beta-lactamase superfamily II)
LVAGQTLQIGGQDWQIIIGRGHAVEHVALHCPAAGVLISGDMLLPRITSNVTVYAQSPTDDTLTVYLDSVSSFSTLPDATLVLPSHGLPFTNMRGRIEAIRLHHAERLALLESACTSPKCAAELLPVLFGRNDFDPHQNMFAMGEAIAHVNHLCHAGRLVAAVDESGVFRFTQAAVAPLTPPTPTVTPALLL